MRKLGTKMPQKDDEIRVFFAIELPEEIKLFLKQISAELRQYRRGREMGKSCRNASYDKISWRNPKRFGANH